MKAWGSTLDPTGNAKNIRYIADKDGKFVKALDLDFDASALLGNFRSKRYALLTKDGKVEQVHVEPDNIGVDGMSRRPPISDRASNADWAMQCLPSTRSCKPSRGTATSYSMI